MLHLPPQKIYPPQADPQLPNPSNQIRMTKKSTFLAFLLRKTEFENPALSAVASATAAESNFVA
jgi:hypothetical protein